MPTRLDSTRLGCILATCQYLFSFDGRRLVNARLVHRKLNSDEEAEATHTKTPVGSLTPELQMNGVRRHATVGSIVLPTAAATLLAVARAPGRRIRSPNRSTSSSSSSWKTASSIHREVDPGLDLAVQ
jgi:hypothetical protein